MHIIQGRPDSTAAHIAIAVTDRPVGRVIAAQAADELLNIAGIEASFVLFPDGGAGLSLRPVHGEQRERPGHLRDAGRRRQRRHRRGPGPRQDHGGRAARLLKEAIDQYFDDEA